MRNGGHKRGPTALAILPILLTTAATGTCPTATARDETDWVYGPPRVVQEVAALPIRLTPGVSIATEAQEIVPDLRLTDRAVDIAAPVPLHLPAGTTIGRRWIEGEMRPCVFRTGIYEPPIDDEGRPFPSDCFAEVDHDGRYHAIFLYAYHAAPGKGIVAAKIEPVGLRQASAAPAQMVIYRRLRLVSLSQDRARFAIDNAVVPAGSADSRPQFNSSPAGEFELPLREGDMEISGLPVHLLHLGDSWTATPAGPFPPWIVIECDGVRVRALGARP